MSQKPEHESPTEPQDSVNPENETTAAPPETALPGADSLDLKQLRAELDVARKEVAENLDKFLRAKAEGENIRRRAENDVANARKYAVERFAGEMLAARDSLDLARAVELPGDNMDAIQKMREGLKLTLKLMDDIFAKFSLVQIDPKGEKFDPERHHAISMVETDEVEPNHVVTVVQKGYGLHDRVLRPAMVIVSRAQAARAGDEAGDGGAGPGNA